uniref:Very-long-chain 3-oxoacyl-CoA synthase n=1 Tax=Araucaria cunninghamii TaxID=56994 RepID=A0A0D6QZU9_ARACU
MMKMSGVFGRVQYWLAEQPAVAHFRWDHHAWGSTWTFLIMALGAYLLLIGALKLILLWRKRPVPLGPIPAIHNLCVVLASMAVFVGCWVSTVVEIRETRRWRLWRSGSAAEWIMCFPLGTRPSGRVFFWSYLFYLTKYHQLFETVIWILRKKPLTLLHVFHHVTVVCMCFIWLEFSQSLQIVGILSNTLVYAVIYSYFLWRSMGLPLRPASTVLAAHCQMVHLGLTVVAHAALLGLHFKRREGCNGMGAWLFNAFLNAALLLLFLKFYLKKCCRNGCDSKLIDSPKSLDDSSSSSSSLSKQTKQL